MKGRNKEKILSSYKETSKFSEKHPVLNTLLSMLLLLVLVAMGAGIVYFIVVQIGRGIKALLLFLDGIISTSDKVIVVALLTGTLSILGVVISSTVGKIYEYRYNVKKYQYEKKEKAYEEFVSALYKMLDKTRKNQDIADEDTIQDLTNFSQKLTLWGSNSVIRKWLNFRENSQKSEQASNVLFLMEDILFAIRKDLGHKRVTLKKGDLLSFFINDIKNYVKK